MTYTKEVLSKLVAFNTDSSQKSNYVECAAFLVEEGQRLGLHTQTFTFTAPDGKPRPSVLMEKNVGAKETMLLLVHFDVVPAGPNWVRDPFTVIEQKGNLYGRGVADDKAGIACCLTALKEIQKPTCNVKLLITCDEEVGGEWGIQAVFKHHREAVEANYCVVVDGGLDYLAIGCSGIVWGTITITGKGGHAAYDFKVPNLVHASFSFLDDVKKFGAIRRRKKSKLAAPKNPVSKKMFGRFNLTMLSAGTQPNALPNQVIARFDLRLLPEEKPTTAFKSLQEFIQKTARKHHLTVANQMDVQEAGFSSLDSPYTKRVQKVAENVLGKKLPLAAEFGGIDGMHVAHAGIPTFNIGPGEQDAHSTTEHIAIKDLEKTTTIIKRLLTQ